MAMYIKIVIMIICLVFITISCGKEFVLYPGTVAGVGRDYSFIEAKCQEINAEPAVIETAEENTQANALCNDESVHCYIGLVRDDPTTADWYWVPKNSAPPFSYSNWGFNEGQPQKADDGKCVVMLAGTADTWHDSGCKWPNNLLCQTTGNPVGTRDCTVLAIDEFLLQCSNEFSAQTVSVSDLDSRITASETNLNQQISNNIDDIIQLQTDLQNGNTGTAQQIADLQSGIVDVNARIDLFAAKAPVMAMIDESHSNGNNFGVAFKDLVIILLLVSNLGVMCYIHCYKGESVKKTVILDEI
eukprot:163517_1